MAEESEKDVRIHIDRKPYESPKKTSGSALYRLGGVAAGYELFREVRGDKEDDAIANTDAEVKVKEDEHFYSAQVTLNPGEPAL